MYFGCDFSSCHLVCVNVKERSVLTAIQKCNSLLCKRSHQGTLAVLRSCVDWSLSPRLRAWLGCGHCSRAPAARIPLPFVWIWEAGGVWHCAMCFWCCAAMRVSMVCVCERVTSSSSASIRVAHVQPHKTRTGMPELPGKSPRKACTVQASSSHAPLATAEEAFSPLAIAEEAFSPRETLAITRPAPATARQLSPSLVSGGQN